MKYGAHFLGKQTCEATKRAVFIIYKMQMPADALFRLVNKERHEDGEALSVTAAVWETIYTRFV